jgi:hypothetical protein
MEQIPVDIQLESWVGPRADWMIQRLNPGRGQPLFPSPKPPRPALGNKSEAISLTETHFKISWHSKPCNPVCACMFTYMSGRMFVITLFYNHRYGLVNISDTLHHLHAINVEHKINWLYTILFYSSFYPHMFRFKRSL